MLWGALFGACIAPRLSLLPCHTNGRVFFFCDVDGTAVHSKQSLSGHPGSYRGDVDSLCCADVVSFCFAFGLRWAVPPWGSRAYQTYSRKWSLHTVYETKGPMLPIG